MVQLEERWCVCQRSWLRDPARVELIFTSRIIGFAQAISIFALFYTGFEHGSMQKNPTRFPTTIFVRGQTENSFAIELFYRQHVFLCRGSPKNIFSSERRLQLHVWTTFGQALLYKMVSIRNVPIQISVG